MDFGQIPMPFKAPASDDPFRIFASLPRVGNAPNDLWHGQAQALEHWKTIREESDVLISLNTGAGKTLVGLLIAQSLVNEGVDNVIYACPTNDLVMQTAKQAQSFGLSFTTRMESKFSNDEFELGSGFCITNYSSIFNGFSGNYILELAGQMCESSERQAGASEMSVTEKLFERAYNAWRESHLDEARDGLPLIPASSDSLFQTLWSASILESLPLDRMQTG